jgi:hypothetical protein
MQAVACGVPLCAGCAMCFTCAAAQCGPALTLTSRHPELVSGSHRTCRLRGGCLARGMPKQVRHDLRFLRLIPIPAQFTKGQRVLVQLGGFAAVFDDVDGGEQCFTEGYFRCLILAGNIKRGTVVGRGANEA